jgi:DNA-binding MarR family transcriptional regulator
MKLDWMQQHRMLIEKMIKFGNAYANSYKVQRDYGTSVEFSALQIQVFEYILETEEINEKMSVKANRLGVSKSTFSKNVKILMEKGMLEKFRRKGNQKDVFVKPTSQGRDIYSKYVDWVRESVFNELFKIADQMSEDDRARTCKMLDLFSEALIAYCGNEPTGEASEDILLKME